MPCPTYTCDCCKQPFTPSPQNIGRQKYCRRKACVKRRRKARQNPWSRERYAEDPAFRAAVKARVKTQRHRLKIQKIAPALVPSVVVPLGSVRPVVSSVVCLDRPVLEQLERMTQAMLGLASQFGGENNQAGAGALVDSWADRGARLGGSLAPSP